MLYKVFRKAVFMEDEGREEFICTFRTREHAQDYINKADGKYFKPSDYYIIEHKEP